MWKKAAWSLLAGAMVGTVVLVYVPPTVTGLVIAGVAFLGTTLLLERRNAALLAGSLLFLTLLLEVVVRVAPASAVDPYYRPHEMAALDKQYKPSVHIEMKMPHGDLLAIDPFLDRALAQPRQVLLHTDARGYRNEREYDGSQRLVVVGDSFVVGEGGSQDETVVHHLQTQNGVAAYNLGFQAGPLGYAERINWARREFAGQSCLALLMFEGNDFQPIKSSEASLRADVPQGLQAVVKGYVRIVRSSFHLSRVVYGLSTRAIAVHRGKRKPSDEDATEITFVREVGGKRMAFLRGYADVTRRPQYDDHGFIAQNLARARPDIVVFVPDKFRVYAPLLDEQPESDLPNAQWEHLERIAKELGIPAVSLTAALQARSAELLPSGEFTFWQDDTHWNSNGSAVAATVLVEALTQSGVPRCRDAATVAGRDPKFAGKPQNY